VVKVHSFVCKVSIEAVQQMDEVMSAWMTENQVVPQFVVQTASAEGDRQGHGRDPVLITSIWYDGERQSGNP
jgi:hypothetical protein